MTNTFLSLSAHMLRQCSLRVRIILKRVTACKIRKYNRYEFRLWYINDLRSFCPARLWYSLINYVGQKYYCQKHCVCFSSINQDWRKLIEPLMENFERFFEASSMRAYLQIIREPDLGTIVDRLFCSLFFGKSVWKKTELNLVMWKRDLTSS